MQLKSLDEATYPLELRWLQANGFTGFMPWHLIDEASARGFRAEFRRETASDTHEVRDLLPFAARQDCDDIAGFVVEEGSVTDRVVTVHLTWSGGPEMKGYPGMVSHDTFWTWLDTCIADTAQWCNEENFSKFFPDTQ